MKNIYTSYKDLPKLTPKGYLKIKCPKDIFGSILEIYNLIKCFPPEKEEFTDLDPKYKDNSYSELFNLNKIPYLTKYIHNSLHYIHEWFCQHPLEPSAVWGIRSYKKGASMKTHLDWVQTHQISSIIMVDKDLGKNEDWPLKFKDHNGIWNDIYTEPGDIILYESAICEHGREDIFKGNYFRNFYMHYKLKNWEYIPILN